MDNFIIRFKHDFYDFEGITFKEHEEDSKIKAIKAIADGIKVICFKLQKWNYQLRVTFGSRDTFSTKFVCSFLNWLRSKSMIFFTFFYKYYIRANSFKISSKFPKIPLEVFKNKSCEYLFKIFSKFFFLRDPRSSSNSLLPRDPLKQNFRISL